MAARRGPPILPPAPMPLELTVEHRQHFATQGFLILPQAVPVELVHQALRAINHELGNGMDPALMGQFRAQSFCPELRARSAITDLFTRSPAQELLQTLIGGAGLQPIPEKKARSRCASRPWRIMPSPHTGISMAWPTPRAPMACPRASSGASPRSPPCCSATARHRAWATSPSGLAPTAPTPPGCAGTAWSGCSPACPRSSCRRPCPSPAGPAIWCSPTTCLPMPWDPIRDRTSATCASSGPGPSAMSSGSRRPSPMSGWSGRACGIMCACTQVARGRPAEVVAACDGGAPPTLAT